MVFVYAKRGYDWPVDLENGEAGGGLGKAGSGVALLAQLFPRLVLATVVLFDIIRPCKGLKIE